MSLKHLEFSLKRFASWLFGVIVFLFNILQALVQNKSVLGFQKSMMKHETDLYIWIPAKWGEIVIYRESVQLDMYGLIIKQHYEDQGTLKAGYE